jgi:hypothetical protein
MIAENYACAYREVIEVLKYTKREDVNKIPKYRILLWKTNMKKDYDFQIDITKPLVEQNLSNEAKAIIANIFKKYWATDYQRERIEAKEKYDMEQLEKEKQKKYNPDNIFKNKSKSIEEQLQSVEEKSLVVENEEKWYKKIFSIIRDLFNRDK